MRGRTISRRGGALLRTRSILAVSLLCATLACSDRPEETGRPDRENPTAAQSASEGDRLRTLVEDYFEESLEMDPLLATLIGDHSQDGRFENTIGPEYRKRSLEHQDRYLRDLRLIDPGKLDEQDLLTYEVFKYDREIAIRGASIPDHLVPLNQVSSIPALFAQLGSGDSIQPFDTVEDYDRFLSRMEGFVAWMDQAIANMREGMAEGIVQPKVIVQRTLPLLASQIVGDPRDSAFYQPIRSFPPDIPDDQRTRLAGLYESAIRDRLVPAYRRVHDFLRGEYLRAAGDRVGLEALPGGDRWYAWLVEQNTTTSLKSDVIHQIGINEVKRIHLELRDVQARAKYAGSMRDFFVHMSRDRGFTFRDGETLITGYRALRDEVHPKIGTLFDIFPGASYEIRAVEPAMQDSAPSVSYEPPPPDGSGPAIFRVNTANLGSRPRWAMASQFLHEAEPGHHLQLGIQAELTGLPWFRKYEGVPAFTEGWGLYAESLGTELGIYYDPYRHFGALSADLWRAILLVVDTGLHDKGWSQDEALAYMVSNAAVDEMLARAEVERLIALPAQAMAYKVGQLKIATLRTLAERRLGDAFDAKAFHREVLEDGALPLEVLERKIERWIARQEQAATGS